MTWVGFLLVFVGGWVAHTAYVRWLWGLSASARRKARGGYKKRRRLWDCSGAHIADGAGGPRHGKGFSNAVVLTAVG